MKNFSSAEFIQDLKDGKKHAFEAVVDAYTQQIFRASLGLGFSQLEAADLVQNVWESFFKSVPRFEGRSHIRTFLFGILYNKAKELRREHGKFQEYDAIDDVMESKFLDDGHYNESFQSAEEWATQHEGLEIIEQCLDKLPLNSKMAFMLKYMEGESGKEICNILGLTITNLGVVLHRTKQKLRECINQAVR